MNVSASQQPDRPTKGLSLKWTGEDIEVITNWLMVRDTYRELRNLLFYLKGNETEAARQLLVDSRMEETKLGVTTEKTRDKIRSLTALYETWRNKADETGWGLDVTCHDQVMENTRGSTIREGLIQKYPWEIMGGSPTVSVFDGIWSQKSGKKYPGRVISRY